MARAVNLLTGQWTALVSVFLALAATPAFGQTMLAHKFKKGDKLNYTFATTTKGTAGMPGSEIKSTTIQELELTWIVKAVADGKADVVQETRRPVWQADCDPGGDGRCGNLTEDRSSG